MQMSSKKFDGEYRNKFEFKGSTGKFMISRSCVCKI